MAGVAMKKVYPSAVDVWLAVLLIAVPVGFIAGGLYQLQHAPKPAAFLIVQGCFVGALMAALAVPCRYTLDDDKLTIRCGLMTTEIPLETIETVEPSRSLWSAPALSLRRVKIVHGPDYALISPREREQFIGDLRAAVARKKDRAQRTVRERG